MNDDVFQECDVCLGEGSLDLGGYYIDCPNCEDGLVPHDCEFQPDTENGPNAEDEVAALQALDDQIKADLYRDAQILGYLRQSFIDHGFSEQAAEAMAVRHYCAYQA